MSEKNFCKRVYDRCFEQLRYFGISDSNISAFLVIEDYEEALASLDHSLSKLTGKYRQRLADTVIGRNNYYLNDLFDILRFYKSNLHFYVEGIPKLEKLNTTVFQQTNRDFCLNIKINGRAYSIYAFSREFSVQLKKTDLSWTFQVYENELLEKVDFHAKADNIPKNNGLDYALLYIFHINVQDDLRKIYISPNPNAAISHPFFCGNCEKCATITGTYGNMTSPLKQYSIKYRGEDCPYRRMCVPTPADILTCAIHALECYNTKETITKKNNKKAATYKECAVHVANSSMSDKVVLLPLHEYVAAYKASHKSEYRGGHHASPVAHTRRGFFRKSRKRGDYIIQNGEYVYVGNMQGTHSFVSETRVNDKSDKITIYQPPTKQE